MAHRPYGEPGLSIPHKADYDQNWVSWRYRRANLE
jgi:hypothetical protein